MQAVRFHSCRICERSDCIIVWAAPQEPSQGRCWLSSCPNTLLNHLKSCPNRTDDIRELAVLELNESKAPRSRGNIHPPAFSPSPPYSELDSLSLSITPPYGSPVFPPTRSGSLQGSPAMTVTGLSSSPTLYAPSTSLPPLPANTAHGVRQLPSAGHRTSSRASSLAPAVPQTAWSMESQREFESRIARITASANIPLSWVDDPEFVAFVRRFIPAARPVSRRVLTSRLIPSELNAQRLALLPQIENADATLQCDGWSGGNFHHYTGFTMTICGEVRARYFFEVVYI